MEKSKRCFVCNQVKLINDFYKHGGMPDGYLNKCKECAKKQARERGAEKRKDPVWIEKERARGREKYHRLGYIENSRLLRIKNKESINNSRLLRAKKRPWMNNNIYKSLSRYLKNRNLIPNNFMAHHWNYDTGHLRDVFILSKELHYVVHRYIIFDENSLQFIYNGELLDTKEKHMKFIMDIKEKENIEDQVSVFYEEIK